MTWVKKGDRERYSLRQCNIKRALYGTPGPFLSENVKKKTK